MHLFKFIDRGFGETILLVPGWASDHRIFGTLDLNFNYLIPERFSPAGFAPALLRSMEENGLDRISVLGWSMGGFLAHDLLSGNGDRIDKVILVGVRRRYKKSEIEGVRSYIKKNKKAFLYKFYGDCFSPCEGDALGWFKANLMKRYCEEMETGSLLDGLDYLSSAEIRPGAQADDARIRFIHGRVDRVAPISELECLKGLMPASEFTIIDDAGHMPFLRPNFGGIINGESILQR